MALKFLNDGYFAGKVGIGTESPVRKLHIQDTTGNPQLVIGDGASAYSSIQSANSLYINAGEGGGGSNTIFRRGTSLAESMRIDSSGNVGIGTASPTEPLTVSKTASGSTTQIASLVNPVGTANTGVRLWMSGTNTTTRGTFIDAVAESTSNDHSLRFGTSASSSTPTERMRITSSGNVGIGTTSPDYQLEVENTSSQATIGITGGNTDARLHLKNNEGTWLIQNDYSNTGALSFYNSTHRVVITESGNVGIGTTSPSQPLEVHSTIKIGESGVTGGRLISADSMIFQIDSDNTSGSSSYRFRTNGTADDGTELMRIQENGNVGIGTTSPSEMLEIKPGSGGDSKINMLDSAGVQKALIGYDNGNGGLINLYNQAGTRNVVVRGYGNSYFNGGNFGIGTTSPTANLHVKTGSNTTVLIEGNQNTRFASLQLKNASQLWVPRLEGTTLDFVIRDDTASSEPFRIKPATSTGSNDSAITIDGNANVGIGTTTPTAPLHIEGGTNSEVLKIEADSNPFVRWVENGTNVGFLQFLGDNAYLSNMSNGSFFFRTNNTDKMTITTGGNVGIGTTSPQDRLHVKNSDASGSNSRCDIRLENGLGYAEFGVLSNYARIQANGNEVAALSGSLSLFYGSNWTFGSNLTTVTTDGKLTINSGNGTGGEAYLNLSRNNVSGFILNHTATAIQVRATANIPMFFYTNDTIGIKLNANSTVSFPEYAAGYLKTDASGNITADNTGGGLPGGPYLPLAGGTLTGDLTIQKTENVYLTLESTNTGTTKEVAVKYNNYSTGSNYWWSGLNQSANYSLAYGTAYSGANVKMEISTSGNATFAGDITLGANYIGRDGDNYIGFQSDNLIKFRVNGATQVKLSDGIFTAQTDSDVDLGSSGTRFKELWVDSINGGSVVPGSYLPLAGGTMTGTNGITMPDDFPLKLGVNGSNDSQIFWNGNNLEIQARAASSDIVFRAANSSAQLLEFLTIDGGVGKTRAYKDIHFQDNIKATFGDTTSPDLEIYHNATDSVIKNNTGDLYIENTANDKDIIFMSDNGSGGTEVYFELQGVSGGANPFTVFPDLSHLVFGNNHDFQIFHDGSNSYIKDTGTGDLYIQASDNMYFQTYGSGKRWITLTENAGVDLFHNDVHKLSTGAVSVGTATDTGGTLIDGWITTTQANAINNTTIATTAYVNNKIALIPAGLRFEGTWDASTGNPPSASPENGQFWIVSVAGSTSLSGITDWKVGDWAIYVVAGSGTDGWQKVDNSSVLDGSGTGQYVTKWDGSGTSNTLTNGPITFSGNDSTFAGDIKQGNRIVLQDNGTIQWGATADYGNLTWDTGYALIYGQSGKGIKFGTNGSTLALELDTSQNATFAGNLTARVGSFKSIDASASTLMNLLCNDGSNAATFRTTVSGRVFEIKSQNSGTLKFDSTSSTFTGNVILGTADSLYLNGTTGLRLLHDGSNALFINQTAGDFKIQNSATDKDIIFRGQDGGSTITALTLDMSDGGWATFNSGIHVANTFSPSTFGSATFAGKVGVGTTSPTYKLDVNGGIQAGGKVTYTKSAGSLNTTGYAVAGITALPNGNGFSCGFTFTCFGGVGKYQKLVYSCYNSVGTWNAKKVIDEGTNDLDVVASANGSTITFTFKAKSSTQSFTPRVTVEAVGTAINSTYA